MNANGEEAGHTALPSSLEFPTVKTPARVVLADGIDRALTERKAVAVYGRKGDGKSLALAGLIREFHTEQLKIAKERREERYRPVKITLIESPRAKKPMEMFTAVHRAVSSTDLDIRTRNGMKSDGQVCAEVARELAGSGVGLLVFDEAEKLTPEGLVAIRDLMSECESIGLKTQKAGKIPAMGIGILLVGTQAARSVVSGWTESGNRLVASLDVPFLTDSQTAGIYKAYLPGLASHITRIGTQAWTTYLKDRVLGKDGVPMRFVESHCRNYARLFVARYPQTPNHRQIGFDEEVFLKAAEDHPLLKASSTMQPQADA